MSIHSCNELCDIDDEFHSIQKQHDELELGVSKDEMRAWLIQRISRLADLLKKLED